MSHELRTPTAVSKDHSRQVYSEILIIKKGVIGLVDLLRDDPTLSQEQREYVDSISLSAKALLGIVNDILDFTKIENGRLDIEEVPFSISNEVGDLCKLLGMYSVVEWHFKILAFVPLFTNRLQYIWRLMSVIARRVRSTKRD